MNPIPAQRLVLRDFNGTRVASVYVAWERQTLACVETQNGATCTSWIPHDERSPKRPSSIARRFAERRAAIALGKVTLGEIVMYPDVSLASITNEDIVPIDDTAIGEQQTLPQYRLAEHEELNND